MGRIVVLLLGFCTLHISSFSRKSVEASVTAWMANSTRSWKKAVRSADEFRPINCGLATWSPWTPCNSCTESKLRFRYLEKPSQFGGIPCIQSIWDRLACPNAVSECMVPDYCGESFTCKYSGRCISRSLRCNGEGDCSDFSDEDNCAELNLRNDKCSTLLPIPGAELGTQGFSVLTGDFVDPVLDPHYFGGSCEYVYNGEWRKFLYDSLCENLHYDEESKNYRKPYNYHSYRFLAEATSEGSHEYYEDVSSLLNARKTMHSSNAGVTVAVYYVQVGLKGSSESDFLTNITKYNNQEVGFVRLFSKVQTAVFKMRSSDLMLHEDFYYALMELPEEYDFGMYSRFFKTFGTHYITEGTMGGTLEYVVVVNKNTMAESKMEGGQVGSCIGGSIGLSNPLGAYGAADLTVGGNHCSKNGEFNKDSKGDSVQIEDIVTLVKGGILHHSSGLLAIRNPDTYKKWGASLKYNPTVIDYETLPIYELVRRSTAAPHVGQRLVNLKRGWEEYQRQFDSCRCAPCKHNGIAVLVGTSCECKCKSGYRGLACEETLRRDTTIDGSWSCWGSWSPCASGRTTRTRNCDNPLPSNGATCQGSASQTQHC